MGDQKRPLRPGEPAPDFSLPAANFEGMLSLAGLRGRPFLIGFFRGLHCPFCRRQVVQLDAVQPTLREAGIETLAVINTPLQRARMYFRHRPTAVTLLSDPDCLTHRAFGVPHIEFAPEGSTVRVAAQTNGGRLTAWVEDEGPGLGTRDQASIFDRFYRGTAEEPEPGGLGLGLWIVKSIVERQGGTISVARTPEQRTRFTITLPIGTPA